MIFSRREKQLILLLGYCELHLIYFILTSALGFSDDLSRKIQRRETMLARAKVLATTLSVTKSQPGNKQKLKSSLIGYIEQLAGKNALKKRIQLNRVPSNKDKSIEAVDINWIGCPLMKLWGLSTL